MTRPLHDPAAASGRLGNAIVRPLNISRVLNTSTNTLPGGS